MTQLFHRCPCCGDRLAASCDVKDGDWLVWCRNAVCKSDVCNAGATGWTVEQAVYALTKAYEKERLE